MIDQAMLKDMLRYDPETGVFYWKKKTSKKTVIGKEAGGKNVAGYIVIGIAGKIYYAHRLAWIYMTGNCPSQVDHADNVKTNNRWENLRAATHQQNVLNAKRAKNNTSGRKGVTWHKGAKKWSASIFLNGKPNYLGLFNCPDEAHEAYMNAATAAQPDFARSE